MNHVGQLAWTSQIRGNCTICIPWALMMVNEGYMRVWEDVWVCMRAYIRRSVYTLINVTVYVSVHVDCVHVSVHVCTGTCVCVCLCVAFWGFINPFCIPLSTEQYQQRHNSARVCPSGSHGVLWPVFNFLCCTRPPWHPEDTKSSSGESRSGVWLFFNALAVPSLNFFSLNSWSFSSQFSSLSSSASVPWEDQGSFPSQSAFASSFVIQREGCCAPYEGHRIITKSLIMLKIAFNESCFSALLEAFYLVRERDLFKLWEFHNRRLLQPVLGELFSTG